MQKYPFPVDPELTQIAMAYRNKSMIADSVLPIVPVGKQSFKYSVYAKEERFTVPETLVGRKSRPNQVEFGADEGDIVHAPSGQKLRLQRTGGVNLLRMMVKEPSTGGSAGNGSSPLGDAPSAPLPQSISSMEGAVRGSPVFSRPRTS